MQIHQILIRPDDKQMIIVYMDTVGRRDSVLVDLESEPLVQQVVDLCKTKLPPSNEHPAKSEIEQEIAELEYRLGQLKTSIGVA